ncbi:ROK family protein [Arthrobacter sp. HLT1-20]
MNYVPAAGSPTVSDTSHMRAINARAIFQVLRRDDWEPTLTELKEATGLSRPTLEAGLAELAAKGWIAELSPVEKPLHSGRPARRFRFLAESGCVAGVDVGPNKVDLQLADLRGDLLVTSRVHPPAGTPLTPLMVNGMVTELLERPELAGRTLHTVTVGVPGVVNNAGEMTHSFVMPHWANGLVRDELSALMGAAVRLENDANLATQTEFTQGSGQGSDSMVYLMLGTRISSGSILNGRLHRGAHGAAGEVGSLPSHLWPDVRLDLLNDLRQLHPTDGSDAGRSDADLMQEVFTLATAGDAMAGVRVQKFVEGIADALVVLLLALDPELVVVGGGTTRAGNALLEPLQKALDERTLVPVPVKLATHADGAVVQGALLTALADLRANVFGG